MDEAEINYTLTNSSNRDICSARLGLSWIQNGERRKTEEYPSLGCLTSKSTKKIKDTIWWKYDANNFLYPKMVVESVWYGDDCRGKLGWNSDLECEYIHGVKYLTRTKYY